MTELASDNFNRADNADLGANWTPIASNFKIVSNAAAPLSNGTDAEEVYDGGITWPNDQYSQVTLGTSGGGAGTGMGICFRAAAGAYYRVVCDSSSSTVEVDKFNPAFTQLGSSISTAITAGDVIRAEMSGSTITVYKNTVSIGTRTDSAITSGKPGVSESSTVVSNASVDDWSGGSLATPATGASIAWITA